MSYLTIYLLCVLFASVNVVFITWWEYRRVSNSSITLSELMIGVAAVCIPVLNVVVWFVSFLYIIDHIGNEIVIFGKKK